MILINQLISAILQVVILIAIPFIFYLVKEKRVKGFFNWIGFKTTENNVKSLKEFGCNINNYNPYQNSDEPKFRNENINWF